MRDGGVFGVPRRTVARPRPGRAISIVVALATAILPLAPMPVARAEDPEPALPPIVSVAGTRFLVDGQPIVPRGFNSIALLHSDWCSEPRTDAAAAGYTVDELG